MKKLTLTLSCALLALSGVHSLAHAEGAAVALEGQAYAFQTAPAQKNGAAFLTLDNTGAHDLELVEASSPVAETVELHSMAMTDNVMEMRKMEALPVPAAHKTVLAPMGNHIMLIGLHQPLTLGEHFPVTLSFSDGETLDVSVSVVKPGTKPE
jgi:copper(I)-binding protein